MNFFFFFFRKLAQPRNVIEALYERNGNEKTEMNDILTCVHSFYSDLYRSEELDETAMSQLLSKINKKAVEATIGGNAYQHSRVNQWTTSVAEQCLRHLSKLGKPFKYIVTCIIMQKNGAGLQTASTCFWDNSTDGSCSVRWENKSMYCIVSVFGLAI
uniref:dynein light chain Tctex-type 1-like n=1 Tax=Epinephelus lanceolatus TaxID=310571 RepID=UPI001444DBAF|nr:dynein light chain Tctex-type 1-like [Epinephelus lanceolatus]